MKRKSPAERAALKETKVQAAQAPVSMGEKTALDRIWAVLFAVLLLLSMTVQTGRMSVLLLVAALALSIGRQPLANLRQRFCVPVLGFIAFAFLAGFAAIYSHFGDYAVAEYQKFLAAFALAVIVLTRVGKGNVRAVLWGMAAVCAVISLLCVDAEGSGLVFWTFNDLVELLGGTFATIEFGTNASRVNGIYNDANVSASILALGSLVSLYLADSAKVLWKKALACVLLGMSAMGFFLSMSRGGILCFSLALLVWLIAVGKGNRLSLFFLMFFSAIVILGMSIPAASRIRTDSALPDILTLISGLVIFALDWALGSRLVRVLEGRGKAITITAVVLAVLCVGYGVAAMTITKSHTFRQDWNWIDRVVDLSPGDYTLSGDWDGNLTVRVFAQSKIDVLHGSRDGAVYYEGPLEDTAFTVTGEELRLSMRIWGDPGDELRKLTFSDGTEVTLDRPLLPSFLTDRLQDNLLTSISFLQRLDFFKDGWNLFGRAPLLGSGLGSTEGLLTSVQSYYYESKYVHNHIIQVMDDMGLVGLAAFLCVVLGSAWLLLCRLREERDGLAALLLACWLMMNTHSLMEINFSVRAYQCLAFPLLLLPAALWAKPLSQRLVKVGGILSACLLWLYMAVFGGLFLAHRSAVSSMSKGIATSETSAFMSYCKKMVSMDVFDHEYAQLTYVVNAAALDDSRFNGTMEKYVKELRASGTYTACADLSRHYYLPKGQLGEMFSCSREGIAQEASNKDAWNLQFAFYRNEVLPAISAEDMDTYLNGVLGTKAYLDTYSKGRLEEIELTGENQVFLDAVEQVRELPAEAAYAILLGMSQRVE